MVPDCADGKATFAPFAPALGLGLDPGNGFAVPLTRLVAASMAPSVGSDLLRRGKGNPSTVSLLLSVYEETPYAMGGLNRQQLTISLG